MFKTVNILFLLLITSISAYAIEGIVTINNLNFRETPSIKAHIIDKLQKGEKVTIIKSNHHWLYITDNKLQQGWVFDKFIKIEQRGISRLKRKVKGSYQGRKYALVIGINAYSSLPLAAAVNDAKTVSKRLKELGFQVTTLLDKKATVKRIRSELGTKLARTNKEDQVLIYFAGHGITENLPNKKEGYILPVDANIKDIYSTAISMTELRNLSAHIPAKHLLYIFDSCYSGLGLKRSRNFNSNNENHITYLKKLAGQRAVYMITAGKADETAREIGNHGIFTLKFLEGMAGAADMAPKDNIIQSSELGRYLSKQVTKLSNGQQNPQYGLLEGTGDFLFPLQVDDPKQLRILELSLLEFQYNKILKRKSLQQQFNEFTIKRQKEGDREKDQYDTEIAILDLKISKINQEIIEFSQQLGINKNSLINQDYSTIKFLNTQKEIEITKVFRDYKTLERYFSRIFGIKIKLSKKGLPRLPVLNLRNLYEKLNKANNYKNKVETYTFENFPLQRKQWRASLLGIINKITLNTLTPSFALKNIKKIQSNLRNDNHTYVNSIKFDIKNITNNKKLLTFKQIKALMISKYGKPTKEGRNIYIFNWKINKEEIYKEQVWENEYVQLVLTGKIISKEDLKKIKGADKKKYDGLYEEIRINPKRSKAYQTSMLNLIRLDQNNTNKYNILKRFCAPNINKNNKGFILRYIDLPTFTEGCRSQGKITKIHLKTKCYDRIFYPH